MKLLQRANWVILLSMLGLTYDIYYFNDNYKLFEELQAQSAVTNYILVYFVKTTSSISMIKKHS